MKTKATKQPKKSKSAVPLPDLKPKRTPKGGATGSSLEGSNFQHNETLVKDEGR